MGVEALLYDTRERPGVVFADLDLIGIPHRIVISDRGLDAGKVEYKGRRDSESQEIEREQIGAYLRGKLGAA